MKRFASILTLLLVLSDSRASADRRADIQWKPADCSSPLMVPDENCAVSQFGRGQYRVDGPKSVGHFNNIYIIFQATNALSPAHVAGAAESTFKVKDQTVSWRTFKTVVEGRNVIRKEALLTNTLPRQRQNPNSDYIWLRIDADSKEILDALTPVAENILRSAASSKSESAPQQKN